MFLNPFSVTGCNHVYSRDLYFIYVQGACIYIYVQGVCILSMYKEPVFIYVQGVCILSKYKEPVYIYIYKEES